MEGFELIASSAEGLTWKELRDILNNTPEEHLKSKTLIWTVNNEEGIITGSSIGEVYKSKEDMVNFSGEGLECKSSYEDELDIDESDIVITKGTLMMTNA